jgi:hypothetical protein
MAFSRLLVGVFGSSDASDVITCPNKNNETIIKEYILIIDHLFLKLFL